MSVKVITQLHPFSNERNVQQIEANTVSEILKKIDSSKAVNTGWRVLVNDQIITDFSYELKDSDTVYIKLVPEGDNPRESYGTGFKAGGFMLAWAGVALMTVCAPVGFVLLGVGVSLLASGTIIYYGFNDKTSKEKSEQSPQIRGSRNQTRLMENVPILLGERRVYSDNAAIPYTWVEDGEQYLYQLLCCGQKDQVIDGSSICIGETNILEYSESKDLDKILSGEDDLIHLDICYGSSSPSFFNKCVHEEIINSVIRNKEENSDADFSIVRSTPDNTEEINVDIFFLNGLGKYDDKGNVVSTTVEVEAYYKLATEGDSAYQLLGYFGNDTNSLSGSELKTKRYSVHKTNLAPAKYTVKLIRKTADNDSNNKIIDDVYLGSIRSIKNQQAISSVRCEQLTLIGLKIKASLKLNGFIEQLNFVTKSILPVYSGSSNGSDSWNNFTDSSNPASAAIYAMQGPLSQQKLADSEIDWPAFGKLYSWCQTHGYECNEYITASMPISEVLQNIGSTCRAEIVRQNGKITVIQDIQRDGFVQMFTPRNSWEYEEQISMADIPDAIALSFVDKDVGYAEQELHVYNTPTGNKIAEPESIQNVSLWGVTSSEQARRLGMYNYAIVKNRPLVHKFKSDFEYMLCAKGDWIKYAGDVALAGITQGRITEVITKGSVIVGFKSDELITMESDHDYAVRIRSQNGTASILRVRNDKTTTDTVYFESEVGSDYIQEGDLFAFGYPSLETIDLIITDIQCEEGLTATIIAVEYAPEIFDIDNPGFILPNFQNKITDIPSVVDGGTVDLSDWQTFVTYNDSEVRPNTPQGSGNSDGWHTFFTSESRWQSTKRARSINQGSWNSPVNIAYQDAIDNLYSNHIVTLYRELQSGEAPLKTTGITALLTYNFASNSITWSSSGTSNGWSLSYPTNPKNPVYVTSATAFGKETSDVIAATEWAQPILMGQNGINGISVATITLYKRSLDKPAKPYSSATYCFNDASFIWDDPTQSDGWQRDIPALDEEAKPIWAVRATALSTKDSAFQNNGKLYDEITAEEWSNPEQYSANEIWSKAEIEHFIKNQINDSSTPYIFAEPQQIGFSVNSNQYVPISQTISVTIHVLQFNSEVDFILGDLTKIVPDGFSTLWNPTTHELTITAQQARRIVTQNWIIPLTFKAFKARWGYKESGVDSVNRYVNIKYVKLSSKPDSWETHFREYYIAQNNIPVVNTDPTWKSDFYYAKIIEYYGSVVYQESMSTQNVQISIVTKAGGRYLGTVASLSDLANKLKSWQNEYNGLIIGDYFSWIGDTTASPLVQGGRFDSLSTYCYVNKSEYTWTKDTDRQHIADVTPDIVNASMTELELAQKNPDVHNYFDKLFASTLVAKKIVANEALIMEIFSEKITLTSGGSLEAYTSDGRKRFGLYADKTSELIDVKISGYPSNQELDDKLAKYATADALKAVNGSIPESSKVTKETVTVNGVTTTKIVVTTIDKNGEQSRSETAIIDDGSWLYLDKAYGEESENHDIPFVKLSKEGLLTANNAVIYGTIYATAGRFSGELSGASGIFSGDLICGGLTVKTVDEISGLRHVIAPKTPYRQIEIDLINAGFTPNTYIKLNPELSRVDENPIYWLWFDGHTGLLQPRTIRFFGDPERQYYNGIDNTVGGHFLYTIVLDTADKNAREVLLDVPTTQPTKKGTVWNDNGTLKIVT